MTRLALAFTAALLSTGPAMAQSGLSGDLDNLDPKIWVDPNGCHHWLMDDGVEGYLTARLNRDGTPVCPGMTEANWPAAQNNAAPFTQEVALWTDRFGCQQWVADHGMPGFMSSRLDRQGRPVCPGKQAGTEPQRSISLGADALFDTDKSDLKPESVAELNDFGAKARALGKTQILVEGHTDSRGTDAYNQALSERRAAAVAAYLEQNYGLQARTRGYGETSPVAPNDTQAGRQANRRVDIILQD